MEKKPEFIARSFIIKDGKILLCKRKDRQYYFFPGGHVEFGEFAEETLLREMIEEIGRKVLATEFIGIVENIFEDAGEKFHEVNLVYRVEIEEGEAKALEDHLEFSWIDLGRIGETEVLPISLKNALSGWLSDQKQFFRSQNDLV